MRCARAHYVHVVCTSGHPLWQCCKQPIIYSTLISTHVNPPQSSQASGYCCVSRTASWQNHLKRMRGHSWGWFEPAITAGRFPPEKAATSSPFQSWSRSSERKRSTGIKLIGHSHFIFLLILEIHLKQRVSLLLKASYLPWMKVRLSYK